MTTFDFTIETPSFDADDVVDAVNQAADWIAECASEPGFEHGLETRQVEVMG